jgi:hypothetical protein
MDIKKDKPQKLPSPGGREGVKKLSPLERSGRDVVKVLQRSLVTSTADNEKLYYMLGSYRLLLPLPSQMIAFVKLWRYPCPPDSPNFFTASAGKKGD